MSTKSIAQSHEERKRQAFDLVIRGQVSRDGRDGQCFISTNDGLYLANSTACTCSEQPCPHTLATKIYNDIRERVGRVLARRGDDHPMSLFWRLHEHLPEVTKPDLVDKIQVALVICQQLHREERKRELNTFYSVCAAGGGVMFCPVPPKRRGR